MVPFNESSDDSGFDPVLIPSINFPLNTPCDSSIWLANDPELTVIGPARPKTEFPAPLPKN